MSAQTPIAQGEPAERHMTRKQALAYLRERGFPVSESYFNKLCLPSRNAGPPVARWWGGKPLYAVHPLLLWAESRCGDRRGTLVA
jgi:hypothetical protein